jgi:hypothetical protein
MPQTKRLDVLPQSIDGRGQGLLRRRLCSSGHLLQLIQEIMSCLAGFLATLPNQSLLAPKISLLRSETVQKLLFELFECRDNTDLYVSAVYRSVLDAKSEKPALRIVQKQHSN